MTSEVAHPWRSWRLAYAVVFALATVLHLPALANYFDNDDAWNYALEAEMAWSGRGSAFRLGGSYLAYQNLHRLIPDASWIPRWALFDLWMPGWKLPSILCHALNASLVVAVTRALLERQNTRQTGRFTESVILATATLAGLLVAGSPLHPHTVSWIGGTYDLFLGAFVLGAWLAFLRGSTWLAAALGLGAAMSKEHGVMVVAVLGLVWLCFDRKEGLWRGVRRLLPLTVATVALIVLRRLQQGWVGGGLDPMAAVRTVVFDPLDLAFKVPLATFAGLGLPLREALSIDTLSAGIATATAVVAAVLVQRGLRTSCLPWLLITSAFVFVAPAAAMREYGQALSLELLIHNARYLYASQLFGAPVLAMACIGVAARIAPTRLALGGLMVLASFASASYGVFQLTQPDPPGKAVATALLTLDGPPGRHVYLLTNTYREDAFRAAMSRFMTDQTGAVIHWVQRGSWRVIERRPDKPDGLDFMDGYIRSRKEPFAPAEVAYDRGDHVLLFTDRSPIGGHTLTPVRLPERADRESAIRNTLKLEWKEQPTALSFSTEKGGSDGWTFSLGPTPDWPRGYAHRPLVTTQVDLVPKKTVGLRIAYTATAPPRQLGVEHTFEKGYLEAHFGSNEPGGDPDAAFVVLPIFFDGARHKETVWLDIDPVFQGLTRVDTLGLHPLDKLGAITVHAIEVLVERPPVRQ